MLECGEMGFNANSSLVISILPKEGGNLSRIKKGDKVILGKLGELLKFFLKMKIYIHPWGFKLKKKQLNIL